MAQQTRRSISVKGLTYQRLQKYLGGKSLSGFVEGIVVEKLGEQSAEDRQELGESVKAGEKGTPAQKAKEPDEQDNDFPPAIRIF